ncbi:hypothetical protein DPEC_G00253900 [Dallia pectoralis]|uniref:Uncharacterized protein n=1 Tax=Dallia pectoralis TaxID=75939 RepID=A0ACC2FU37_DALPE|nr:hypothetical protein DPEC_G00253900 [Dallia pectoralis]
MEENEHVLAWAKFPMIVGPQDVHISWSSTKTSPALSPANPPPPLGSDSHLVPLLYVTGACPALPGASDIS